MAIIVHVQHLSSLRRSCQDFVFAKGERKPFLSFLSISGCNSFHGVQLTVHPQGSFPGLHAYEAFCLPQIVNIVLSINNERGCNMDKIYDHTHKERRGGVANMHQIVLYVLERLPE